ncbi:hypothetical protein GCK72_018983 [Caenorhabditis remanei]|uniref:Rho-GAP domain-containing protein n=1 Tax=Caenorhabditis remanei TaxID=31234 RepID=A0A6A5GBE9_CAERE|nr:hypothetical protein GCK72_018983 [Caenorhabditis remanei]KAF1752428.1 hypothetical protein GCK72_018983 [Caenorhabditis remanei]
MEHNDFRVVSSSTVSRKGSTNMGGGMVVAGGLQNSNRFRYTLGEVCSTNVTLDVNVGTGWTRIRLKEVPKFIVHAFNMISKYGMENDGLFRKEGNAPRLNRVETQMIYRGQCDISGDYTVADVCTMVKRFLRDLKPPLLDSEQFRARLLKKACQARISDSYLMTREEMADMFYVESKSKEKQTPLLSDVHSSTLGYVMRQLYRISMYSDKHKMSIENLAVVLVGSVFGDGIHDPKKSGQMRRGSRDDILAQKKQDMNVHVAAVKLLITNANLIGVRRDPYVTSNAMARSSSAMPRCMSSGYETASSEADCMSTKTSSSTLKSGQEPGPSSHIYRRDSEAAHKIVTSRKKGEANSKKKRSASFLPSFRDLKHRLTNMKRAKSPSPDRLMTGHSATEPKLTDTSSSDMYTDPHETQVHRKKVARNESNTASTGSTASGRQSRSQQSRRLNTNAVPRMGSNNNRNVSASSKPTIAKIFDTDMIPSSGALRRLSASDQNSDAIRFAKHRSSNEKMSATEFLMSEHQRDYRDVPLTTNTSKILKRNTMVLGENSNSKSSTRHTNRRHTAPIHNNRPRRNRPNTVGTGLPHRKDSVLNGGSSIEEKENQADCETDDALESAKNVDHSEWLLEQKALEARSRRAGRKQKQAPRNINTESTIGLNGSMAEEPTTSVMKVETMDSVKEESPQKQRTSVMVVMRKDLDEVKNTKQFCDTATSPMVVDTPKKQSHENGHVWVGTKQVVTVTPTPTIARRQSRARLSYSKANESSPLDMPSGASRRESSPLMSPILKHVTITNNSPQAQVVTSSPRSSLTPKSHVLSPLVIKMDKNLDTPTPPPVPPHSPPNLTPQTSRGSMEAAAEMKRITISGVSHQPRRPPTPPSHPKMSNPFSPKLPIRSVTIDNGFELPSSAKEAPATEQPPSANLFKLPQLPITARKMTSSQISPLAFQRQQNPHQSKSTLSVPNRANLRETKSIDPETLPLRSAPLHGTSSGGGQLSPRSNDYFEFGKYTNALRSATDEFALPHRKLSVETRPSVAIIRTNNCGLVRSRVHHFQEIEQLQRIDSSMSGRLSALSQTSLRSNDTHPSSSDRFSDVSDLRHNLTSSESNRSLESTPSTPTATAVTSRVSYGSSAPRHHF